MEAAADVHASWVVASGSLLQVVRVVAATSVELGEAGSGAHHGGAINGGAVVRLRRPPDVGGACEVTVQFMQRSCRVRRVCLVASARNCEIYGQQLPGSELEYACTVRGTPASPGAEVASNGTTGQQRLYEATVELADPAVVWASALFKLLSLADKDEAVIASLVLEVSPGPAVGAALTSSSYLAPVDGPAPWMGLVMRGLAQAAGGSSSSPMPAELPDVPAMAAMKRALDSARDVGKSTGAPSLLDTLGAGGTSSEPFSLAKASSRSPQPVLEVQPQQTEYSRQGEAGVGIDKTEDNQGKLLQSMASRLERVEAACLRIESGFERTLRACDERLRLLEDHVLSHSGDLDQPCTKTNGGLTLASQTGRTPP